MIDYERLNKAISLVGDISQTKNVFANLSIDFHHGHDSVCYEMTIGSNTEHFCILTELHEYLRNYIK